MVVVVSTMPRRSYDAFDFDFDFLFCDFACLHLYLYFPSSISTRLLSVHLCTMADTQEVLSKLKVPELKAKCKLVSSVSYLFYSHTGTVFLIIDTGA